LCPVGFVWAVALGAAAAPPGAGAVLKVSDFRHYVDQFNAMVTEDVVNAVPNADAWEWLTSNVPFFACPDRGLEQTYYYRWWAWRKHLKRTPKGWVITEFLRPVGHASEYNAISCALGHHVTEGHWVRDRQYVEQYARFWLQSGENGGLQKHYHNYSSWAAAALYDWSLVNPDRQFVASILDSLILDYRTWEKERLLPNGLFWQYDVRDGMEDSVSGSRRARNARPTINSYMYGNARAVAEFARLCRNEAVAREFDEKAARLRALVQEKLWDARAQFFKPLLEADGPADVRELMGYTPWYFRLPDAGRGYEVAWKQVTDPEGFFAPFGPTTAERRHPGFRIADRGDDCQWNGPSWPFATTVTLKALAYVLNDYPQRAVTRDDYFKLLTVYSDSQRLKLPDGRVIPWVDENLNPLTGEWQARAMKIKKGKFNGRGDHYNHSGFADLVITGLVGVRPRADDVVEVNSLVPEGRWHWFCLDRLPYHGRLLTILWDKDGSKYELAQFSGLKLLDLEVPPSFAGHYPGPRFGIDGTRRLTGVYGRPLIGTIIKPSVGLSPRQTAELVATLAAAGVDFIKDDELMADPPHSRFDELVGAVMRVLRAHAQRTGKTVIYAFNVSDEIDAILRHYDAVVAAGGTAVMVSLNGVGLAGVRRLCDRGALAVHGHRNGWGMLNRHPLLGIDFPAYQKLWRLAGVDHIHVNGLQNKFWEPDESVVRSIHACLKPMLGGYAILPVMSSGQWGGQAPETYRRTRTVDLLYLAGGGIMAHPDGPAGGVTALRQAWEAAMAGLSIEEAATKYPELARSVEKFGRKAGAGWNG
jgi:ribulose 1,5-bisphosphate carboxylase large subunit-like protein